MQRIYSRFSLPTSNSRRLQAPFPWFGGKSRAAHLVWPRFGYLPNYVEPFFGSGAVLLARPHPAKIETVNDIDGFVANFWRAVRADPQAVAEHAAWPVLENDLHARHIWLVGQKRTLAERLEGNPYFYDTQIAGWWVWGMALWIGGGFCSGVGPWSSIDGQLVHLGNAGQGVTRQRVHLGNAGQGVTRRLVHLGDNGLGVKREKPYLSNDRGVQRKRVMLGGHGSGVAVQRKTLSLCGHDGRPRAASHSLTTKDSAALIGWFESLAERLRRVRVCCGDWSRVTSPAVTFNHGVTGVFLDPPYSAGANRDKNLYNHDSGDVALAAREWAIENGGNRLLRIALCGYEGEYTMPRSWECVPWKAAGGYAMLGNNQGRKNKHRERIWFSPHCLKP